MPKQILNFYFSSDSKLLLLYAVTCDTLFSKRVIIVRPFLLITGKKSSDWSICSLVIKIPLLVFNNIYKWFTKHEKILLAKKKHEKSNLKRVQRENSVKWNKKKNCRRKSVLHAKNATEKENMHQGKITTWKRCIMKKKKKKKKCCINR